MPGTVASRAAVAEPPATSKRCPFCQGTGTIEMIGKLAAIVCSRCGAGSEPAEGEAAAIRNWRRLVRAPEARPSAWFTKPQDGAIAA